MDALKLSINHAITQYFINLEDEEASNIYELVINQVEKHLLTTVMQQAQNNQSKAARWLGLSRNTLRKLLEKYGMLA